MNNKGQLTTTASPAQPRRPEILRLATATAFYGGGGNFLRLATAYELYGDLRRLTAAARGSILVDDVFGFGFNLPNEFIILLLHFDTEAPHMPNFPFYTFVKIKGWGNK